jgi:hypothetical protein
MGDGWLTAHWQRLRALLDRLRDQTGGRHRADR